MRIAIIEDHPLVASSLKNLILNFWKESKTDLYNQTSAFDLEINNKKEYQLIIADIHLVDENILEWLKEIKIKNSLIPILLYTSSQPWEISLSQNYFPFDGYVQKNAEIEELLNALASIEKSTIYFDKNLIWEKPDFENSNNHLLTNREREILALIKEGKTSKEMAEILFLSEFTIKSHRQNMMRKFQAKNVIELISKVQKMI